MVQLLGRLWLRVFACWCLHCPGNAGIGPMLFCCWAGVLNGGPAVKPLWVVVWVLPGDLLSIFSYVVPCGHDTVWRWSSVVDGEPTLGQRLLGSSCIAHRPNINLINPVAAAGHCAGVVLMLGFCLKGPASNQPWFFVCISFCCRLLYADTILYWKCFVVSTVFDNFLLIN